MENILNNYIDFCKIPSSYEESLNVNSIFNNINFQHLFKYADQKPENIKKIMIELSNKFESMDILKACATAHFCGALIEKTSIFDIEENLISFFKKVTLLTYSCCKKLDENENLHNLFLSSKDEVFAYKGCELLTLSVMSLCAKNSNSRILLRKLNIYDEIDFLTNHISSMVYVNFILNSCSNFKVLVLCPETKNGVWVLINDLHNLFYVFSLLEAELFKKNLHNDFNLNSYEFNDEIYQILSGKNQPKKTYTLHSHCHYFTYKGILKEDFSSFVFGEMPPESLPKFQNQAILVLKKDSMKARRSWDSNFTFKYHSYLKPKIEILEQLTKKEVSYWIKKISHNSKENFLNKFFKKLKNK